MTAFVRFDGVRRRLGFRVGLLISVSAFACSFSGHASAQTSQAAPPPRYNNINDLGIGLTTGRPNISFTEGAISGQRRHRLYKDLDRRGILQNGWWCHDLVC